MGTQKLAEENLFCGIDNRIRSKTYWKTPGFKTYGVF